MRERLRQSVVRSFKFDLGREHLIDVLMTVGVVGMNCVLLAFILMRLAAAARTADHQPPPQGKPLGQREVVLGQFKMTSAPSASPDASSAGRILEFGASVLVQDRDPMRRAEQTLMQYDARIRAAVDSATRHTSEQELLDPALKALRGRIRSRVNRLLGSDLIKKVVVSDFRYYRF